MLVFRSTSRRRRGPHCPAGQDHIAEQHHFARRQIIAAGVAGRDLAGLGDHHVAPRPRAALCSAGSPTGLAAPRCWCRIPQQVGAQPRLALHGVHIARNVAICWSCSSISRSAVISISVGRRPRRPWAAGASWASATGRTASREARSGRRARMHITAMRGQATHVPSARIFAAHAIPALQTIRGDAARRPAARPRPRTARRCGGPSSPQALDREGPRGDRLRPAGHHRLGRRLKMSGAMWWRRSPSVMIPTSRPPRTDHADAAEAACWSSDHRRRPWAWCSGSTSGSPSPPCMNSFDRSRRRPSSPPG